MQQLSHNYRQIFYSTLSIKEIPWVPWVWWARATTTYKWSWWGQLWRLAARWSALNIQSVVGRNNILISWHRIFLEGSLLSFSNGHSALPWFYCKPEYQREKMSTNFPGKGWKRLFIKPWKVASAFSEAKGHYEELVMSCHEFKRQVFSMSLGGISPASNWSEDKSSEKQMLHGAHQAILR